MKSVLIMKWLFWENLPGSHLIWHRNRKCVIRQIAEADSILCKVAFSCHIVQDRSKKSHYKRTMWAIRWSHRHKRILLTISGTGIWVGSLREQVPVTFSSPFFTCVCSRFDMSCVASSFWYAGAVKATSFSASWRASDPFWRHGATPASDVALHLTTGSGARFLGLGMLMQDLLALPQFWRFGWLHHFYPVGGSRYFLWNVGNLSTKLHGVISQKTVISWRI